MRTILACLLVVLLSATVLAQQPNHRPFQIERDTGYLPTHERQRIIIERAQKDAEARRLRVEKRMSQPMPRVRWYIGTDGVFVERY